MNRRLAAKWYLKAKLMQFQKFTILMLVVSAFSGLELSSHAQDADNAPIYLDEPQPEPAARAGARQTVKEKYPSDSPRTERQIVKLSDDRIVNDGKYIEFYRDGKKYVEGNYKMGVFDGEWKYWYPNGQICKNVSFAEGQVDGQWEEFNKEGVRTSKKSYLKGKRHGEWFTFHADGETHKLEISYDQGLPVGDRVTYYENGQKRQSISFVEGKMNGQMTEWDQAGKKRAEATFKDGKMVGKVKRFDG